MLKDLMTRRKFLELGSVSAGTLALGSVIACTRKIKEPEMKAEWQEMRYVPLDPEEARRRGYQAYYRYRS